MDKLIPQHHLLLNKAKTDLRAAEVLYKSFDEGNSELDLEIILFHLQQCAEKSFKAILSKNLIGFPKIHDLEALINLIEQNNIILEIETDLFLELSDYAVEGRYSMIHDDIDNIHLFFQETRSLLQQVEKKLSV